MDSAENTPFEYIDTQKDLKKFLGKMKKAEFLSIDTEADSFHHYYEKVCLIQVSFNGINLIIDPLSDIDLSEFFKVISQRILILHDAVYDLRMLSKMYDFKPESGIFDTMLAAQLMGLNKLSLASLLDYYFDINLSKKGQKSDWSRRPLSESQLSYAIQDTCHLESMMQEMKKTLIKLGRIHWHREFCDRIIEMSTSLNNEQDKQDDEAWRIKGISKLKPRQLAFVQQLWLWREKESQAADLPPFKIMNRQTLIEWALWADKHYPGKFKDTPTLPRHIKGTRLTEFENALEKAADMDEKQWPQPRKSSPCPPGIADCNRIVNILQQECRKVSEELKIAAPVLVSKASLLGIAMKKPDTLEGIMKAGKLMMWQSRLIEDIVYRVLCEH